MALDNKATPYYYGLFRQKVLNGEIAVNQKISMQMNLIDNLIANPGVYYDENATKGYVNFCENELTLTNGDPLKLLDSFKLWSEDVLAWYYFERRQVYETQEDGHGHYVFKTFKKRLRNKQYIILGRGGAKSMYAASMQAFFLVVDTSTTHQVTTAPTMNQAEEVMLPIKTAITVSRGPLFKFLTAGSINNTTGAKVNRVKLASTKKGIQDFITGSYLEVRPMSVDKLQGLNSKINTIDEWLSGDIKEDAMTPLEQGAAKNPDWLIIAISSEGTVRNGVGDTIKMELMSRLKGEYYDPHTSIWWYCLDDISEVGDPAMWVKAQPNIGQTVTYETYQREVEKAEKAPGARNDILAKRFGIPMEGYTYYFAYQETIPHKHRDFWRMPCSMGADLSRGDDFCAFTFMFPLPGGYFGIKTRNYIAENTMLKLNLAMRQKYEEFLNEGSLVVMEGTVLDMMQVYEDLDQHILDMQYDVRSFGYDPYNAKDFVERWERENGSYGVTKVIQGKRTESVPLGELKHMAENRLLLFDEKIMQFGMGNCITIEDNNGNRMILKRRHDLKIDPVAAMMDAWVAYKLSKDIAY